MNTKLMEIYNNTRLDFFVMAVNHLCDIGLRMSRKITDEDIENQQGNGLMTKEFCQDLLEKTREIANAIDGVYELFKFMASEDIYGNDKRIVIELDCGGMINAVYGTDNRRKTNIEVVDETDEYWEEVQEEIEDGILTCIY